MDKDTEIFAGYFPVIHDGYIRAFERHPEAIIGVLGEDALSNLGMDYLRKDIRALNPEIAKRAIEGLGRICLILGQKALEECLSMTLPIIMPRDDVTREIISTHPDANITTEPIFLRWDRDNSSEQTGVCPDKIIGLDSDDPMIKIINNEIKKSSNWFRHLGSTIFDENEILLHGHNSSMPTSYTSWIDGDPRITAKKGELIERSIDIHAEANLIALAAKNGISLEGKSICVSTFPCPNCAKLIALSGMNKCYYIEGYAMLDGQSILKNYDVEIIKIETNIDKEDQNSLKPYPSK